MLLIKKGAEADLYSNIWYGLKVVWKVRKIKAYRILQLDFEIRRSRTEREAQIIHDAKLAGVPTPLIYMVDVEATTIIMQYLEGSRIREVLDSLYPADRKRICERIGLLIGRLHTNGIIHGDLTTSNIIITLKNDIYFIDFGLAEYSKGLEKRGVDLLLMRRSLNATHYFYAKDCFDAIVEGYKREIGKRAAEDVIKRIEEIAKRGRYAVDR
ncbi:MAG: KEOPS complex kinase/ATPase Bud32 [Candidatus Bathyarchaeota archaeon]